MVNKLPVDELLNTVRQVGFRLRVGIKLESSMPRVSRELQKQIDKAEKEAKRAVFRPKKKERKQTSDVPAQETKKHYIAEWVKDPLHPNREVFFDGTRYWFTLVLPNGSVTAQSLTVEEWIEREKGVNTHALGKARTTIRNGVASIITRETTQRPQKDHQTTSKKGLAYRDGHLLEIRHAPKRRLRKSTHKTTPSTRIMKRSRSKK